jgi:NTP pyrophosphatase (non-canonical NTP hydrolase)
MPKDHILELLQQVQSRDATIEELEGRLADQHDVAGHNQELLRDNTELMNMLADLWRAWAKEDSQDSCNELFTKLDELGGWLTDNHPDWQGWVVNIGLLAEHAGAFSAISVERRQQDELHGTEPKPHYEWVSLIAEEFGELAKAVNQGAHYEDKCNELIQTAALCVAFWEQLQRASYVHRYGYEERRDT